MYMYTYRSLMYAAGNPLYLDPVWRQSQYAFTQTPSYGTAKVNVVILIFLLLFLGLGFIIIIIIIIIYLQWYLGYWLVCQSI